MTCLVLGDCAVNLGARAADPEDCAAELGVWAADLGDWGADPTDWTAKRLHKASKASKAEEAIG